MPANPKCQPNPLPCGCGIKGTPHIAMYGSNCELRQEYRNQFIDFCPLHSAAPDLLKALEELLGEFDESECGAGTSARIGKAHAAVAKARPAKEKRAGDTEHDRIWEVWDEELRAAEQQHHCGYRPISWHESPEAAEYAMKHLDSWHNGAKYVIVEAKRAGEERETKP